MSCDKWESRALDPRPCCQTIIMFSYGIYFVGIQSKRCFHIIWIITYAFSCVGINIALTQYLHIVWSVPFQSFPAQYWTLSEVQLAFIALMNLWKYKVSYRKPSVVNENWKRFFLPVFVLPVCEHRPRDWPRPLARKGAVEQGAL